jgi:hypothetical protein
MEKKTYLNVQKEFCGECSLALMRFMGNMKGVKSVAAEDGRVVLTFDDSVIPEDSVLKIARDNVEKMGYKIDDEDQSD